MSQFDLSGRTAIVTGGNRGIGRGLALALAGAGANVCVAARDAARTARTCQEIEACGAGSLGVECDVTDLGDIRRTLQETTKRFGACHVLVNDAGISQPQVPQRLSDEQWDRVMGGRGEPPAARRARRRDPNRGVRVLLAGDPIGARMQ